jgi:hypothetical protein
VLLTIAKPTVFSAFLVSWLILKETANSLIFLIASRLIKIPIALSASKDMLPLLTKLTAFLRLPKCKEPAEMLAMQMTQFLVQSVKPVMFLDRQNPGLAVFLISTAFSTTFILLKD